MATDYISAGGFKSCDSLRKAAAAREYVIRDGYDIIGCWYIPIDHALFAMVLFGVSHHCEWFVADLRYSYTERRPANKDAPYAIQIYYVVLL